MDHRKYISFILVAISAALVCCSSYPKGVGPLGPDGNRLTWTEMSQAQRKAHMSKEILPAAADLFSAWRPELFAEVDCTLCHGLKQKPGNFKMPNAHLPRLSGELLLGPEFKKHPETTRLKLNRLVPMMADSLGLKTFSIVTRTGFGCYSCHLGPTGAMFGN
jgi:hypothetical protein